MPPPAAPLPTEPPPPAVPVTGEGLAYLRDVFGVVWPFGYEPIVEEIANRDAWDAFQWNPPPYPDIYPNPDPNASPKPSWDELVLASRLAEVKEFDEEVAPDYRDELAQHTQRLATVPAVHGDKRVHVGGGLSHMDGLHYSHGRSTGAGMAFRRSVLRTGDQTGTVDIWTRPQLQRVLDQVAGETDLAESARNVIAAEFEDAIQFIRGKRAEADDTTAPIEQRQRASDQARSRIVVLRRQVGNFGSDLAALVEKLRTSEELPDDLPTLKEVLIERLEANGMARIKEMRGNFSQQGIDLPPTCDDSANAEREVAALVSSHRSGILNTTSTSDAKAAYARAVKEIAEVEPLNVPEWEHLDGTAITGDALPINGTHTFFIHAVQPEGVEGPVSIDAGVVPNEDGSTSSGTVELGNIVGNDGTKVTMTGTDGKKTTFRLQARNICGLSKVLLVVFDDTGSG